MAGSNLTPADGPPIGAARPLTWLLRPIIRYAPPIALLVVAVALWQVLAIVMNAPDYLVPKPSEIAQSLAENQSALLANGLDTLQEVLFGFAVAIICGVVTAALIAESRLVRRSLYPLVVASQTVPIVAIAPLILIWFGFGTTSKVAVAAFIAYFPIVVNATTGLTSLDRDLMRLMQSFPASRWQVFFKAKVPSALPYVFAGMKIGVVLSVIGAVVGEFVGSESGLGHFIIQQNALLDTTVVFAAIVVLSAMGITLFIVVSVLERLVVPWHFDAVGNPQV